MICHEVVEVVSCCSAGHLRPKDQGTYARLTFSLSDCWPVDEVSKTFTCWRRRHVFWEPTSYHINETKQSCHAFTDAPLEEYLGACC